MGLHLFDISIKMKLTKLWKGLMDERLMAEKSLFSLLNTAQTLRRFPKEELWNHLQGHGGQEAVVLEGAVALIDAAVPAGGPEMITGKETTGRGAEVEAMKGGVIGIMTRIEIIAVAVGLVVPALMTNAESEAVMMMRDAVAVAP